MSLLHRSGVSDAEVARALPGDDLVREAVLVVDRAATLPAPAEVVWPWLVQLGKGRAGWYFPRSVERLIPGSRRGLRRLDSALLEVRVADRVPDWGPGRPWFCAALVDPERALVWLSARDKAQGWGWPTSEPWGDGVVVFSWALCLEPVGTDRCRLHVRLRWRRAGRLMRTLGGLVDWVTVALLFRGLSERLVPEPGCPHSDDQK